jgi:hypothetical protein
MVTVARCHNVLYNRRILCARVDPAEEKSREPDTQGLIILLNEFRLHKNHSDFSTPHVYVNCLNKSKETGRYGRKDENARSIEKMVDAEIGTAFIDWVQLSRFYLKMETESSLRNVVFSNSNMTVV